MLIDRVSEDPDWNVVPARSDYAPDEIEAILADPDDADVIRNYGVRGVSEFVAERRDGGGPVGVTLFEMRDSTAAFGIFALERDRRADGFQNAAIGIEGYRQDGRLVVWQSNYVAILEGASPGSAGEDVDDLGVLLSANIVGSSRKAPVSTLLPREGLIEDSERYILTPEAFQETTGISPLQLGFDNSAEAAVAEYASGSGGAALLALLLYPTQHLASLHLDAWIREEQPALPNRRTGPLLGIVVSSDDDALTESVLGGLRYESEVTWNEPLPDPLTLPDLILSIFAWIGIALGFTVVVGLGFGAIRIYMKTRYPDRFLGASPNAEFIQLKIGQLVTRKELDR